MPCAMPWNAESLYTHFMHTIHADVLAPPCTRGFFGMGTFEEEQNRNVFGVWLGMFRYGLVDKEELKDAIRTDNIGKLFDAGLRQLAARGHKYALLVSKQTTFFDGLPPLGPEPQRDLVGDTELAFLTAIDTYTMPQFHTEASQQRTWDKAEALVMELLEQPGLPGAREGMRAALEWYEEAQEIYGLKREPPARLVEALAS